MQANRPQSLRRLLLIHELAFVSLVVISGALGASWAYVWQQWSEESIRLNYLAHTAAEIRSQLFKQIQDVSVAGLHEEAGVRELNSRYTRTTQELFNELRRKSTHRGEDYAVQSLQTAFSLLQANLREVLRDPLALNRLVRAKVLDPKFEARFVADFEAAHESFAGLLAMQLKQQELVIGRWTELAPYGLGIPIVVGIGLLLFSRRSLTRGFVEPMQAVMLGTRAIRGGKLEHSLPVSGVAEMRELARAINQMAVELEASRDAILANERQAALGALVPVVAHNIRNPLAAIRANAQLLDGQESAEEAAEIRSAVIETVDRLGRWVTALVSYLHPLSPRRLNCPVTAMFDSAVRLLEARALQAGVSITRSAWDEQAVLEADPDLLEQALYGLLNNALEASSAGQVIDIGVASQDGELSLWISDQAGGIPFQPEPSELAPGPSTKRFGTGLGIPVAYKICGVLGLRLEFVISEGQGTRAIITARHTGGSDSHEPE